MNPVQRSLCTSGGAAGKKDGSLEKTVTHKSREEPGVSWGGLISLPRVWESRSTGMDPGERGGDLKSGKKKLDTGQGGCRSGTNHPISKEQGEGGKSRSNSIRRRRLTTNGEGKWPTEKKGTG